MSRLILNRRRFLAGASVLGASTVLAGCDQFDGFLRRGHPVRDFMIGANQITEGVQRTIVGRDALAREFSESEIRQGMRPNGSTNPETPEYLALRDNDFADYVLPVGGLVETPAQFTLAELRNMPARTQITRHDCVEGWSCIAKWTGVPLATILDQVRPTAEARYVVFRCFDTLGQSFTGNNGYYESIDLLDARHPQTILAYGMNDAALPVSNGAPLRVRIERQLGYKMAKYIQSIELVASFADISDGNGGYWPDRGYEWYAGI